ncbi:MAG TPA: response regulator transcription factor [Acidimicrobiales bacterium]|nr:response regulator transcription factor [Acidimicrobiales bacterium]
MVADDQEMVRTGFRMILAAEPGLEVVGEAVDGREAVDVARRLDPDVVLMDVRMPGLNGIEATRVITNDATIRTRVLVLTTFEDDEFVHGALQAGASGYLLKESPAAELVRAIEAVAAGDAFLGPSLTRQVIDELTHRLPDRDQLARVEALSPREREVLRLVARGLTNAEIARSLFVSEATVKTHVARLLQKLGARDRVQAVVVAYESGFVARDV